MINEETAKKRVLKRYKLLRAYLKRPDFAGVMLDRKEVREIVEMMKPFYDQEKK